MASRVEPYFFCPTGVATWRVELNIFVPPRMRRHVTSRVEHRPRGTIRVRGVQHFANGRQRRARALGVQNCFSGPGGGVRRDEEGGGGRPEEGGGREVLNSIVFLRCRTPLRYFDSKELGLGAASARL